MELLLDIFLLQGWTLFVLCECTRTLFAYFCFFRYLKLKLKPFFFSLLGSVSESSLGDAEEDDLGEHGPADMLEQTEENETGDEDGTCDASDSQDLEDSSQTVFDEPESTRLLCLSAIFINY